MPATKWLINQNPAADRDLVGHFKTVLATVKAKVFVLVSTIDVYGKLGCGDDLDETSDPEPSNPYGLHRLMLEKEIREIFPESLIVRLPALFGNGLKKNILYDIVYDNRTSFINRTSKFQWYDISELWSDIQKCLAQKLPLVNLFPEPISTSSIIRIAELLGFALEKENLGNSPIVYDAQTKHSSISNGGIETYWYSGDTSLKKIKNYLVNEKISKCLGVSSIGWKLEHTAGVLDFLSGQNVQNLEIAPTSIWGSWDEVGKAMKSGEIQKFALSMKSRGFRITSIQAVMYMVTYNMFTETDEFINHMKSVIEIAHSLSLDEQEVRIVFGSPKNRVPPETMTAEEADSKGREVFWRLGEYATGQNACVVIEANPKDYGCGYLYSLADAGAFVKTLNHPKVRYMLDTGCACLGEDQDNLIELTVPVDHVHMSMPFLKAIDPGNFAFGVKNFKDALLWGKTWVLEMRSHDNVETFYDSLLDVKEILKVALSE